MLIIDESNIRQIFKLTSVLEVLRTNPEIKLDLPEKDINKLIKEGLPISTVLRTWLGCTKAFVDKIGIERLSYNELEAVAQNPAISKMALENHRFEQLLPKPIFDEAMSGLSYKQCVDFRLDIIDTLKCPTIKAECKNKLIEDAFKSEMMPIDSIKNIDLISSPAISLLLAENLMDIKYKEQLVVADMVNKEVVRNAKTYTGLMMLLIGGGYDVNVFKELFELCDHYAKYDYIRNLPKIPSESKTKEWFEICECSSAAIKYVACCGKFNKGSLLNFVTIIEKFGSMADMVLLYENDRLSKEQRSKVRSVTTPTIKVADYRPAMFNKYITEGDRQDIENFAVTYKQYPSAMLLLQSPEALALTGSYYMYHLNEDVDFLLEYLLRTHTIVLPEYVINKIITVIIKSGCFDAMMLFLLSSNISTDDKIYLFNNF